MTHFKERVARGDQLVGTFVKATDHTVAELLMQSGLDFICLDAEHAPYDRVAIDAICAVARARDFPVLVRVPAGHPETILGVLDSGATGIVVPHVDSVEKAQSVAKSAHYGLGGRGFAGSTRWAGLLGAPMADTLARSARETVVFAQIEEPAGVDAADEIAAVDGIDGLFIGPSDLSVSYGKTDTDSPELHAAYKSVSEACQASGAALVTWAPNGQKAADWAPYGVSVWFLASELSWMLAGARGAVAGMKDLVSKD